MSHVDKPLVNPSIVLREEFDDWAILFDSDTGDTLGINPVGVFIWKHLDGRHTPEQIYDKLSENCADMPADAKQYIHDFVEELVEKGYAGFQINE